jgi:hypothetical protein
MTVAEAIEIRDRAISLGLESCCDECRSAIERLSKLGTTNAHTLTGVPVPDPTYPQRKREATIGLGQEASVRWLRRHIGAAA